MAVQFFEGIGRRKESTSRVRLMSGTGQFTVNDKPMAEYFPRKEYLQAVESALQAAGQEPTSFDISARVNGGGTTGQADAIVLGIARALIEMDPELRPPLRKAGLLTRDARVKERKKPGLKRARKAPTYTKR